MGAIMRDRDRVIVVCLATRPLFKGFTEGDCYRISALTT